MEYYEQEELDELEKISQDNYIGQTKLKCPDCSSKIPVYFYAWLVNDDILDYQQWQYKADHSELWAHTFTHQGVTQ